MRVSRASTQPGNSNAADAQQRALLVERKQPDAIAVVAELARLRGCGAGREQRSVRDGVRIECGGIREQRVTPAQHDIRPIAARHDHRVGLRACDARERERRRRKRLAAAARDERDSGELDAAAEQSAAVEAPREQRLQGR